MTHLFVFALTFMLSFSCFAAPAEKALPSYTLNGTQIHSLKSKVTGLRHELIVSLPASYATQQDKTFPVLYFLDAYWDMPLLYGIYGNLMYDRVIPDFILVGLSLPEGSDYGAHRTKYFSPSQQPAGNQETGHAQVLYAMLTEEAAPYIEKHFRASSSPKMRALAGQSMGGLFALNALYQSPQFFSRFIAVNPAASWDDGFLMSVDKEYAKAHKALDARVFISHGSEEYAPFRKGAERFKQQLSKRHYKNLALQNYTLQGMRHTGGKGEAYSRGILWIFKDIAPISKSGLQADMGG